MEFKLFGKIAFNDFVSVNNFYLKYSLFNRWRKIVYPLVLALLVSIIIFIKEYYLLIVIPVFFILFYIFYKRDLRKKFLSSEFLTEEQHYSITEERIEVKTESTSTIITKDKIYKIMYNKNEIYIFISTYYAYVIPKTFLHNNDFELLKDFMNRNY